MGWLRSQQIGCFGQFRHVATKRPTYVEPIELRACFGFGLFDGIAGPIIGRRCRGNAAQPYKLCAKAKALRFGVHLGHRSFKRCRKTFLRFCGAYSVSLLYCRIKCYQLFEPSLRYRSKLAIQQLAPSIIGAIAHEIVVEIDRDARSHPFKIRKRLRKVTGRDRPINRGFHRHTFGGSHRRCTQNSTDDTTDAQLAYHAPEVSKTRSVLPAAASKCSCSASTVCLTQPFGVVLN